MLCHNALKALVMEHKSVIDADVIQDIIAKDANIKV